MRKNVQGGYIVSLSPTYGVEITDGEAAEIMEKIHNVPAAPEGYAYALRADTLEWELTELPPIEAEDATAEDYENALGRFGV